MNRLVTIPVSHFCEKARWALDRAQVSYLEEGHAPILHWRATMVHHTRTVPLLVTSGAVLRSSSDIVRWADTRCLAGQHLFPDDPSDRREVEELEAHFDSKLGPATRRWAYFHLLQDRTRTLDVLGAPIPEGERRVLVKTFGVLTGLMKRGMGIDAAGAARSLERIKAIFAEVSGRLSDGRRYLVGDRFSAADLAFVALAIPALAPPQYPWMPPWETLFPAMRAEMQGFRQTPAGRFALRVYEVERPRATRVMMASA